MVNFTFFFLSAFSSTFLTKLPLSENSSIDAVVPAEHRCKYKVSVGNLFPRVSSLPPPTLPSRKEGREPWELRWSMTITTDDITK